MKDRSTNLTSGRLLARNTIWNLLGQLLPMVVAVATIPLLVRGLGVARFGILSLVWIVIGYFSLFDLGIGRALTKLVADKLGSNDERSAPPLIWTSVLLMFLLGVVGGLVTFALAPWLVKDALKVPESLHSETLQSFYWLAASIPLVTITSGLRGVLEALQQFRIINLIRIPMSIFSFAGPLLVLPFSRSLVPVILVLLAGRFIGCVVHLLACFHALPGLRLNFVLDRSIVLPVIKFGGWMTITNIVSPFMVYLDRFLIGTLLSVSAVAYYTAPFDMVTRVWIIPAAAAGVLFPAFAVSLQQEPHRIELLLNRGTKYVFLALFPIVLAIIALAPEGLRLWLGPVFAENGSSVLRWIAAGVFVNSLAHVPFALIQSAGRPDITAKLHMIELPVYLVAVWVLTERLGIQGTAIAWTGRNAIDACLVWFFAQRLLPRGSKFLLRVVTITSAGLLVLYAATLAASIHLRAGLLVLSLLLFAAVTWTRWLGPEERALLLSRRML